MCLLLEESARAAIFVYWSAKNTYLVEDIEIMLPVKFCWIPFSSFRGEVENVSTNQRSGRPSCFSDRPEKHKLGRGHWDLSSCQVSLNSVLTAVSEEKPKKSQPIRGQGGHLVFFDRPEKHKLGRGRWDLASCQVSLIPFSGFRGEVENVSANRRPGRPSCFSDRPEKHKLGRGCLDLASCQVSSNSVQRFQRRSRKCLNQSEARATILFFPIGPKNTKLVEDIEILLPVKFRWIPFSGFRGEVENVSTNQRPGRPSCFSDRPKKHKLGRGRWDLASCQVSLNSVQRFQRRSRKCEKLTTDRQTDRQTDDGRRTTRDHNSAPEPNTKKICKIVQFIVSVVDL